MQIRRRLELDHPVIKLNIENQVRMKMKNYLGEESREFQEVLILMKEMQEYLIPKGIYTITKEYRFVQTKILADEVCAEVILAMCCKEFVSESMMERFLMERLQVAYMDVVREYVQKQLIPIVYEMQKKEKAPYVSSFCGPGFYEMPLTVLKEMYEECGAEEIGMSCKKGILRPVISFIGTLYVTKRAFAETDSCKECKAVRGCEYCMKYKKEKKSR